MRNPELLLLDEPTEGLAPQFVRLIGDLVLQLKHVDTAVLLAEQKLRFVSRLADLRLHHQKSSKGTAAVAS